MNISEIRIYSEVLEQGLDIGSYIERTGFNGPIKNCYTKKVGGKFSSDDSLIDRIRKVKDADILISAISNSEEYPILMIEYSTAVPTDDHKMQRSDVYYWGAVFKVPVMKISPTDKGMDQHFGGGSRITDIQEQRLAFERGALFYPIKWASSQDVLPTKSNALSCIPYQQSIQDTIQLIITVFSDELTFNDFYNSLLVFYEKTFSESLSKTPISLVRSSIVNSTRFHWYNKKLSVKINRFGHAMDPDRGVLYYANMLVGAANTITEIQVNRPTDTAGKSSYKSLFDRSSREAELISYVNDIIKNNNNIFTDENALYVLTQGLNIYDSSISFIPVKPHEYRIDDNLLLDFLLTHKSIAVKSIFFLSTELRLTDKNRTPICTIKWNEAPISEYLNHINTSKHRPISISPLTIHRASEDIITFASVELYKKLQCKLLAVSYPGAQGDRCILTKGSGRTVLRTYIDIIAYRDKDDKIQVFLEECKDHFSKSQSDIDKLNNIVSDQDNLNGLKLLFKKTIGNSSIENIYTSVAAKEVQTLPRFLVDYIFMFTLSSDQNYTYIDYTVALVNTSLVQAFKALENNQGKLVGRLRYNHIFTID